MYRTMEEVEQDLCQLRNPIINLQLIQIYHDVVDSSAGSTSEKHLVGH